MYNDRKSVSELWAILDQANKICMSRGGSSSTPKIMVYPSEKKSKGNIK